MKHLYIIGNGFDLLTGLKTRYEDFRSWLEINYPFVYENMLAVYDMKGEWWNEFEVQLGKLDVPAYVRKFSSPMRPIEETWREVEEIRKAVEERYKLPSEWHFDSQCARRLSGLLDVFQSCFEKWVQGCQDIITNCRYVHLEKDDSFFISFNYTDVLQDVYNIPEERVLHVHGRASTRDHLVFGHDSRLFGDGSEESNKVCFELNRYEKNPYDYIFKHEELPGILKDVKYVYIYGFSFSPVDEDYLDWIYNHVSRFTQWEVSYFSDQDRLRIAKFMREHPGVKERMKLISLNDIEENVAN